MNYKELFEYEHKKLPLLLLSRKEGVEFILNNFSDYSVNFVPSCKNKKFYVEEKSYVKRYMNSFLNNDDNIITLSFPLEEKDEYIGLAKYGFFVFKKKYTDRRYFLFEMFKENNGIEDVYWYYTVEYRLANIFSDRYEFIKKVYPDKLWLGDTSNKDFLDL